MASSASSRTLNAGADQESLPSYQQASGAGGDSVEGGDETQPVLGTGMGLLNFGGTSNDDTIRRSIEVDEGIGMGHLDGPGWPKQGWTFDSVGAEGKLPSAASQGGGQNSSATDVDSLGPGVGDLDEKMSFDIPEEYTEPPAPEGELPMYDEPPPPDPYDQANMEDIRNQVWANKKLHTIPPDVGQDQASEKAVEIHVSDPVSDEDEARKTN